MYLRKYLHVYIYTNDRSLGASLAKQLFKLKGFNLYPCQSQRLLELYKHNFCIINTANIT